MTKTFTVRLSHDANLKQVEFTAYAFNTDRVKSETAHFTHALTAPFLFAKVEPTSSLSEPMCTNRPSSNDCRLRQ